eukprot:scaffold39060_cov20-Tisochrysis_lutea.AAC.3
MIVVIGIRATSLPCSTAEQQSQTSFKHAGGFGICFHKGQYTEGAIQHRRQGHPNEQAKEWDTRGLGPSML